MNIPNLTEQVEIFPLICGDDTDTIMMFHLLVLVIFAKRCISIINCSSSFLLLYYVYSIPTSGGQQ
jgi:hypothetical protein